MPSEGNRKTKRRKADYVYVDVHVHVNVDGFSDCLATVVGS